ncbi:SAICAR synthase-like protein [Cristinia sonorae]|uniref:Kinase n=1 Tax=Cristinia sonorae TaxID=1940300 RepID=A0A8K0UMI3_9AGAR|nr:SAICAR synthase-like protein [Cristinia sonorae]
MSTSGTPTTETPPTRGHAPLATQVGGHAGVLTSEGGDMIIKPALPVEIDFYQSVGSDPAFAPLRPFIPKFYGTLKLEGTLVPEGKANSTAPVEIDLTHLRPTKDDRRDKESIVLENLTMRFAKPNIMDIKLGTILYDEDATPEKKARMEKTAKETTSFETGVRITGFQVQDLTTGTAVNTPREYGKSLKKEQLPSGIAKFFPTTTRTSPPSPSSAAEPTAAIDTDATNVPATTQAGDVSGLPPHLLLPILRGILRNTQEIRDAVAEVEMRMVGGSLLVIYEADWERAAEGIRREEEGEDLSGEEDDDEDEDEAEEGTKKLKVGRAYVVKLIDFAHTFIVPGRGPDASLLKGLDTSLELFKGRIAEVERLVKP